MIGNLVFLDHWTVHFTHWTFNLYYPQPFYAHLWNHWNAQVCVCVCDNSHKSYLQEYWVGKGVNALWFGDTIWHFKTLVQVMSCHLMAPSHSLNKSPRTSVQSLSINFCGIHLRAISLVMLMMSTMKICLKFILWTLLWLTPEHSIMNRNQKSGIIYLRKFTIHAIYKRIHTVFIVHIDVRWWLLEKSLFRRDPHQLI